jgi:hypothetical protein
VLASRHPDPATGVGGVALWPNIVPYRFSVWDAASSESTQAFLLVGTLFLLPIILMYSGWSYWVFRGKVRSDIATTEPALGVKTIGISVATFRPNLWLVAQYQVSQ